MKNTHISGVQASIPPVVRSFTWVRNHHYVKLEYVDGNEDKLDASTILLGDCVEPGCGERVAVFTNTGHMVCPHCKGAVKWRYTRPQLAFIAENESQFMGWDTDKNETPEK